jgi:FkbM family methyltransferase
VLAAEANPSVRARLVEHLQVNRMGHVDVVPYALGDSDGRAQFHAPDAGDPAAGDGHMIASDERIGGDVIEVETRALDSIVQMAAVERLDLIKIDVEGFEWPVLKGAERSIARFRPHVVFEYIEEYAGRGGGSPGILADFFAKHRYRLFAVGRNWSESISGERWPSNANIWAVPLASADGPVRLS